MTVGGACDEDGHAPHPATCSNVIEHVYTAAIVFTALGLFLCLIVLVYPIDDRFSTNQSAAEVERMQLRNEDIRRTLDDVTVCGVACISIGGLLLAGIMFYMLYTGDLMTCLCGDVNTMTSREETHRLSDCDHLQKQYGGGDSVRADLQMDDVILFEQTIAERNTHDK